jgi:hypothetical protein
MRLGKPDRPEWWRLQADVGQPPGKLERACPRHILDRVDVAARADHRVNIRVSGSVLGGSAVLLIQALPPILHEFP